MCARCKNNNLDKKLLDIIRTLERSNARTRDTAGTNPLRRPARATVQPPGARRAQTPDGPSPSRGGSTARAASDNHSLSSAYSSNGPCLQFLVERRQEPDVADHAAPQPQCRAPVVASSEHAWRVRILCQSTPGPEPPHCSSSSPPPPTRTSDRSVARHTLPRWFILRLVSGSSSLLCITRQRFFFFLCAGSRVSTAPGT